MPQIIDNLKHLIKLDVPKPIKKQYGFLDIIKKTQDETINSNIYAYFLNSFENPVLSDIFLNSLLNILKTKYKIEFELQEFDALTEVTTNLGRIDIVLLQRDRNKVIIIENKINHININPLADYWNHYSEIKNSDKLGLLLTLKSLPVKDNFNYDPKNEDLEVANRATKEQINDSNKSDLRFVNITHLEWINEIKSSGLPFNLDPRTHIYLNDFLKTIEIFSKVTEMDENVKFYFEHAARIQDAIATKKSAQQYIITKLESLGLGLEVSGSNENYRYLKYNEKSNSESTCFTFSFEGLLNGNDNNFLIIEMKEQDKDLAVQAFKNLENIEKYTNNNISFTHGLNNKYVTHFCWKRLLIQNNNIEKFFTDLKIEFENNFIPLMDEVVQILENLKK